MFNLFNISSRFFIIVLTSGIVLNISAGNKMTSKKVGCSFTLSNDIPISNQPIYLQQIGGHYKIFKPENGTNYFRTNSMLTLACLGKDNKFVEINHNLINLTCSNSNQWTNDKNKFVNIKDLNCSNLIKSELKVTDVKCSRERGLIYDVGYKINRNNFLSIFHICYNNKNDNALYSKHYINGRAIQYAETGTIRATFRVSGLGTTSINKLYTRNNQKERFIEYFGSTQNYIDDTMFLARGHLTPHADFIFASEQLSTYFYANVAPEFQKINTGNWIRVENIARKLASEYSVDFEVYTGYTGTLRLPKASGEIVRIYLDENNRIEVPKWFFKVIRNVETNAGIVFITLNNPYADPKDIVEFCPNVCAQASINNQHFSDPTRGYTYCCDVNEFQKVIYDLPRDLYTSSLLDCSRAN